MNQQQNLRDRYIQLVETFITALGSGRSGAELENIRKEIRLLSAELNSESTVENHTQEHDLLSHKKIDEANTGVDAIVT